MTKSNNVKDTLETVGKGILNTLEESTKDQNNKTINPPDNTQGKNSNNTKSKKVNTSNIKNDIKQKSKSSFMLNATANKQLKLLHLTLDKDLGELVIEAIDLLYRKNEKKIEETISDYFETLKK